jgi:hypothetical protein
VSHGGKTSLTSEKEYIAGESHTQALRSSGAV